jgi:hypothetical protein
MTIHRLEVYQPNELTVPRRALRRIPGTARNSEGGPAARAVTTNRRPHQGRFPQPFPTIVLMGNGPQRFLLAEEFDACPDGNVAIATRSVPLVTGAARLDATRTEGRNRQSLGNGPTR